MNLAWRQRLRATTALQAVATAALLAAPLPAAAQLSPNARPTGGQVVAGQASIGQSTTTTTISQSSQRAAVNWQGFDVGSQQTVQFQQPSSSAVTLNRVVGPNPSEIAGHIRANGQLVVVNQSGVVFDSGSQVNAAGLVVSAAGISNGNFMAGRMVFDQAAHAGAKIDNRGTITVKDHGLAALVAPQVRNSGTIAAKLGTVILAGAEADTLDLYGDGLVSINVTKQVQSAPNGTKALVTNSGLISAHGGTVVLTADAVDGVMQTLVDAGGRISANSTVRQTGTVLISGSGGDVRVEGVVSAQGKLAGTTGGAVMVSGSGATVIGAKAQISVAGKAGGGTVALGTTLARAAGGSGTAAATTGRLVMRKGATVSADATAQGNGGRVVLLSTNSTTMAGTITAKGGAAGGNGGFVEISGGGVMPTGHVDATAPKGAVGTLLLDPSDLWVSDTRPSVATYTVTSGDLPTVAAGGAPNLATVSWVSPSLLASQNANIVLAATDNLYVASSYNTANTLNLGSYTLTLTGGAGLTVDRGFAINASSISLTSQSGPITLDGAAGVSAGLITAPQLAMLSDTALTASTITMAGSGGIALGGATLGTSLKPLTTLDLSSSGGSVTQDAGGVTYATTLTSSNNVSGSVDLAGTGNQITNLGALVANSGITLNDDVATLTVTGVVNGGSNVAITNTGSLVLNADMMATGTVALDAVGIAQYSTTAITADVLTGNAGSGYASFGGANKVQQVGTFSAQGGFGIIDDEPSLKMTGTINGGPGGIYLINTGSLVIGAPLTSTGTVDLNAVGIVQTNAGVITAGTLTGNAHAGAAHLGIATNDVQTLDGFRAADGFGLRDDTPTLKVTGPVNGGLAVYLVNTGSVVIGAPVIATGTVDLVGAGITQYSGGTITAGTLIGNAGAGAAHLGITTNDVTNLGAFTAGQGFGLRDNVPLLKVTGTVDGGLAVYLVNTGSLAIGAPVMASGIVDLEGDGVTQYSGGPITADTLIGNAGTGAAHIGITTNQVQNLGSFSAGQGFGLRDNVPTLKVTGPVDGGLAVYLVNTGSLVLDAPATATTGSAIVDLVANGITQSQSGVVTAGTLIGNAGTGAAHIGITTNAVQNLGAFKASQGFGLRDNAALLTVTGPVDGGLAVYIVNTGSLVLDAPVTATTGPAIVDLVGEGVTQDSGSITAGTLIGNAGTGSADIGITTNLVQNLGSFSAARGFELRDNEALLTVSGPVNGGTAVYLANTGSLVLDAPVTASGVVDLTADGIAQSQSGVITAFRLFGDAGPGAASLGGATNVVTNLGPFTTTTGFGLRDNVPLLTVAGDVDGGTSVYLVNSGSIVLDAPVNGTNLVDLVADGITQYSGGITTNTLIGNAGSGVADLVSPLNMVGNLGPFAAGTGFTLSDAVTSTLTVGGAVDGGTGVAITTLGSLVIAAAVTGSGTVDLVSADGITQTAGGVITAGTLMGDAGTGPANLGIATNMVQNLGPFSAPQGFGLRDGVPLLTVVGAIGGGPGIYLVNSGSLEIDAALTAANTVDLVANGIGQNGSGVITTATLIGDAGGGAADLGAATNSVNDLGPFNAGAGITLNDNVGTLTVAGAVNGGTGVSLTNTGSLLIAADISGSDTVDLIAAGITQAAGSITAGTLTGDAGAGAADFGQPGNLVQNLGPFSALGGFTLTDATPSLTVVGAVSGGPVVTLTNTGSLALDAPIDSTNAVTLTANGISQAVAGVITAGLLTGTAGSGDAELASATSMVTDLGPFTAGGEFRFLDGTGLTVIADVTAGSNAAITVTGAGNALAVNPGVTVQGAGGSDVLAATGGDLTNAGTVSAGSDASLTASGNLTQSDLVLAGGDATLTATNGTLAQNGTVTAGYAATLTAGGDLSQTGTVTATNSTVTLTAGGNLAQSNIVTAGGDANLTAQNGMLTQNGSVTAGGDATLTAQNGMLTQNGSVTAGGDATLTATNGTLDQNGIVRAGNAATLTAGGDLSQIGTVMATDGSATLTASGNLTQSNIVTAGSNASLTATNGTLTQSGTVIAGGDATLTAANGTLDQAGTVKAGNSVTLLAGGDLSQVGTVIATSGSATLTAGGNLTQSSIVTAGANAALTATNGTLTQNGTVTAGGDATLTATHGTLGQNGIVTAGNAATLVAGVDLFQTGTVTATAGDATLTAGGNLTQTGTVTAGGNLNLTATNGTLDQNGTVKAHNAATLVAGGDLSQNGTVVATKGDATLTAGGNLTQSSIVTAGADASLTATNGTLTQGGTVTAGSDATLTATNGTLDQFGLVTAEGAATLTAGADLDQTGTLRAGGDATLTAGGKLTQSNTVTAGNDATLTATGGNLTQTGAITAGTSAIIQALAGNVGEGGTVTAPNIQVSAPNGQVNFSGVFAGVQPDPTLNPRLKLKPGTFPSNVSTGAWISGSVIEVAPTAQLLGAGGGLSQLVVRLTTPNGSVNFADFQNPQTQLYLDLGTGLASGQIAVDALQVQYVVPGTTQTIDLIGTVNGQSGFNAAASSFILPLEKENYQVNGCPIGSANCFQFTTLTLPVINPLKDLEIATPDQADDILIILPDVGERDY